MNNKAILFSALFMISSSVWAESSLLEEVAAQAAKDTATVVAPDAVKKVESANQTLEAAKNLKESVANTPDALKNQAQEAVKEKVQQKLNEVTPAEAKQAVDTVNRVKEKAAAVPKSTKALKKEVKAKAVKKTLDLLR